jgi:pyruvate/2-oxoglutarate dehydrogenase complex dihydrolipoamide acyltransferase (E2) component
VTEGTQNLAQQIQEQTLRSAQDFYGNSLGRLKGQLQGDRSQLESLAEQVPSEDAQAQIQEMVDSYMAIEESLDQAAQDLGVQDAVNQAVQQAQEALGQVAQGAQEAAGGAVQQAQGAVGQVAGQAGQFAQGVQDTPGQVAGQAQEAAGAGGQEEPNATGAARQKAEQLGVDLSQVQGSGAGGRITIKDVTSAANRG